LAAAAFSDPLTPVADLAALGFRTASPSARDLAAKTNGHVDATPVWILVQLALEFPPARCLCVSKQN